MGPLGSGPAARLVANLTLLGTLGLLGEALALADGSRALARGATWEVLGGTPLANQAERHREAASWGDRDYSAVLARIIGPR